MENTGRIARVPIAQARTILYGATVDASIDNDLRYAIEVDRAHVVMLAERGLVHPATAARLLGEIRALSACGFAPLRGQSALRGLYLLYEDHLIARLGAEGGALQFARSRNDLNATTLRLRLRAPYARLVEETLRLEAIVLRRARRFAGLVMPAYTHFQPAVPVTLGHHLAAVAGALGRDVAGVLDAGADLDRCPLGAGAVGGTSAPIDPQRTAELLGFRETASNSIDAVASRDVVLRLLAAGSILGVTLSRIATDLLHWTSQELGFVALPDELVSSSSMMPQKRNPFFLEHVQGRAMAALGAFVSAASAMHAAPYSNAIAVGTEATSHVWSALGSIIDALVLLRLVIAGMAPDASAMLRRAETSFTGATELATRLALDGDLAFRAAHHAVGVVVNDAIAHGEPDLGAALARRRAVDPAFAALRGAGTPAEIVEAARYGGGPAPAARDADLARTLARWRAHRAILRGRRAAWAQGARVLAAAEAALISRGASTP